MGKGGMSFSVGELAAWCVIYHTVALCVCVLGMVAISNNS